MTSCIQSLAFGQFVYLMNTIGMRINTALIGLVYEKVIKMLINFNVDSFLSLGINITIAIIIIIIVIIMTMKSRQYFFSKGRVHTMNLGH